MTDVKTDIVIIGGGVAGLSAGARLAPHATVTLLEAEPALGYHTSGRSAALYEASYGLPSTMALARASGDFFLRETDYLSPRGLMLAGKPEDAGDFARELAEMGMQQLSPAEAQALLPILNPEVATLVGHTTEAWDIDTDRLLQDFAKTIRAHGGQVLTKAPVTDITPGARWQVTAAGVVHGADLVINAAGAWADAVAALAGIAPINLQPMRRSMARIPAPDGMDPAAWPMIFGVRESWYMKPDAGALLVSPAEEDPLPPQDAWADDMVLAEGLARYEEMVTAPVTRMISNWAGLRSFAPDRNLVIGPDPHARGFFWLAGQGGYGFLTCPAASQYAADLILGRPPVIEPPIRAALSPERFSK
ncbi:NAD(P)/FAD-dependent oxidoreductase [Pseudodonghicola flavimaris]|uniref:FAD-binding oxidoreductase n=1 Tax=Pseudodonghicola flavimaris TaxID=3050036 RepID=A0ABT7EYG1_9RHOB|nr:FAD-binding oxidoreductase [Pseudodonghicola flavimaris]MDK3017391.1 FAD-binding oxidoreductase [Pseudodonghicola flavimaris]